MTNWRTVLNPLQRPHSPTHNIQNPQNRKAEGILRILINMGIAPII